jgi:pyruvate ferredoxin oxidoreductase gamma subunit
VVTAAELLSVAAFDEGRHAQAFPSFGSERTGAPVVSFCRFSNAPIRTREPVAEPDALIVQDPTLLHQVDLFSGLGTDGFALINTAHDLDTLGLGEFASRFKPGHVLAVPATALAREHLGRPLPNAALLGGFAAQTGQLRIDSIVAAIEERFSGAAAAGNAAAARACFGLVTKRLATVARV